MISFFEMQIFLKGIFHFRFLRPKYALGDNELLCILKLVRHIADNKEDMLKNNSVSSKELDCLNSLLFFRNGTNDELRTLKNLIYKFNL